MIFLRELHNRVCKATVKSAYFDKNNKIFKKFQKSIAIYEKM